MWPQKVKGGINHAHAGNLRTHCRSMSRSRTGSQHGGTSAFPEPRPEKLDEAKKQIQAEKDSAISDIRRQVAVLSVDIAEKVLRKNLDDEKEQMEMIDRLLDELTVSKD